MDNVLASQPVAPGSILGVPKKFSLNVAEIYWHSGQWKNLIVDWTHLVVLDSTTEKNYLVILLFPWRCWIRLISALAAYLRVMFLSSILFLRVPTSNMLVCIELNDDPRLIHQLRNSLWLRWNPFWMLWPGDNGDDDDDRSDDISFIACDDISSRNSY